MKSGGGMAREAPAFDVGESRRKFGQGDRRPEGARLIGRSRAIESARAFVASVARADAPVLVLGPTGSGKEVIARGIHEAGPRARQPFIAINCASLSESLMDSELFGHEKGAFTGASEPKPGKFELARNGTLFLDEIGELALPVQAKLLRVLQEREFYRVGGVRPLTTSARVVAATHRNLRQMVEKGTFREDLYFRLNILSFELTPLAQRREDIAALIGHFWSGMQRASGCALTLSGEIVECLLTYSYPGNVRELHNILERLMVLGSAAGELRTSMLPRELAGGAEELRNPERDDSVFHSGALRDGIAPVVDDFERRIVSEVMRATGFNQVKAAAILKLTRGGLQYKLKKLGLDRK